MKKEIVLHVFEIKLVLLFLGFTHLLVAADLEKSRVITKEFSVSKESLVSIIHERGNLDVEYHTGAKPVVSVNIVARGENEEDLAFLLSKYTLDIDERAGQVEIRSDTHIENWNQTKALFINRTRIKFDDGSMISSVVEDLDAHLTLKIPMITKLSLKNKYHDINANDIPFNLSIHQFSAAFNAGEITGNLEVSMKYGKVRTGNIQAANLEFFDSKVEIMDATAVVIQDKYSNISLGNMQQADLNLFDADVEFGNVAGTCDIKDKYSKIKMGSIQNGTWDLFDAKVVMDEANSLDIKSKYTQFEINRLSKLELESFDDHFQIANLGLLTASQSKYSNFDIEELAGSLMFEDSFDDKIEVGQVANEFSGLEMDAKYTKVTLPLRGISYRIDADVKYGKIEYPQGLLETKVHIEENSNLKIQAQSKGAANGNPLVKIRGFDNKVDLN